MIRTWLSRKTRMVRPDAAPRQEARRPKVQLRLETLEDRTVPALMHIPAPYVSDYFAWHHQLTAITVSITASAANVSVITTAINSPGVVSGLDALWQDLRGGTNTYGAYNVPGVSHGES